MKRFTMISEKTPKTRRPMEKKVFSLVSSLKKKPIVLSKGKKFTIGRLGKNSLPIKEKTVSELHASIKWDVSAFKIKDENSTNGTFVNNKRISKVTILKAGDKIRFGKIVLKFSVSKIREKKQEKPGKKKTSRKKASARRPSQKKSRAGKSVARKGRAGKPKTGKSTKRAASRRTTARRKPARRQATKRAARRRQPAVRRTMPAVTQIKWPLFG